VARFRYVAEAFDSLIKTDLAQVMQQRFWLLNALNTSPLFKSMPSEAFDKLLFTGQLKTCPVNTILFRENDPGQSFFIVVQGSVVFSQGGRSINVLGQGAVFGEVAVFASGGKRTATAVTQADTLLLEVSQRELYQILSSNLFMAKELQELAYDRLQADYDRKAAARA
jgi:CRP-like cAMP-binding protein